MCYSMYGKRSDAAKQGIDTKATKAEVVDTSATTPESASARSGSEQKAYSGFMGRIQRWVAKEDKKREESVS